MSTLELKLAKFTKSNEFKGACDRLYSAEIERIRITELMQPKYDALLASMDIEYSEDAKEMELDNDFEMNWERIYLLSDDCFNELMVKKSAIDRENGFFYDNTICPVARINDAVRKAIHHMIDLYVENVDKTFDHLFINLEKYNAFKKLMISAVMKNVKR